MAEEPLTWALLAPVPSDRLDKLAREYWREEVSTNDDDYAEEGWEVVGGKSNYSAVLDRNPGSQDTHEPALAKRISRALKRPVYVLYLNENLGDADEVDVYEGGRQTGHRPLAYEVAREVGVTLPGDEETQRASAGQPVIGVIVVEGVNAAQVARALDMNELPNGPVHIIDGPVGAVMYNDATDSPPLAMPRLSSAFPEKNVYTLGIKPLSHSFLAWVMRGGEDVGIFRSPASSGDEFAPVLDSVKGETTPRGIAAALGVPPGLLDLP